MKAVPAMVSLRTFASSSWKIFRDSCCSRRATSRRSNGRLDGQLKGSDAAAAGKMDGNAAVMAVKKEGFHSNVLIFLDQEEGGRLLPEQVAYFFAWIDAVESAGARTGVYCSGSLVRQNGDDLSVSYP
jgi:hypothetical protein